jgi:hypothetical protein
MSPVQIVRVSNPKGYPHLSQSTLGALVVCRAARTVVIHRRHPDKAGLKRTGIKRVHSIMRGWQRHTGSPSSFSSE